MHKLLLQEHPIDPELFRIKMWQLPSLNTLPPLNTEGHTLINTEALTGISRLSSICEAYGRLPLEISLNQETVLKTHYEALESLTLRANSKLLLTELSHSYYLAIRDLINIPELSVLPLTAQEAKSQLATLFKKRASNTHPLRHLCFVFFLYGSWETFWKAYNRNIINNHPTFALRASAGAVFTSKPTSDLSEKILVLKNTVKCSSKEAAKILGVNIETLIIHAERCGVPYPKRPKKLTPLIRASILNELGKCIDLQKISDLYQVSIKTLKTLLRANPQIYLTHRREKYKALIESYRQRWTLNIRLHKNETIRGLRKLDSQTYTWLYRHDQKWLKNINKTRTKHTTNNRVSLWKTRDDALLALLLPAIQSLQENKSLSLSNVFNRVPRLKKYIRNLAKLPKTHEALTANNIISKPLTL
ncbi:TnsD family Tn7-like transposition protein [Pseudomonas sp. HLT2-19-2]